jgi:predicted P-loop ATPase
MWATFFDDVYATSCIGQEIDLDKLAERIRNTLAPAKDLQPMLKLARYGNIRSAKGSLRHDGNVVEVCGIELDYDREQMPLAEATARLDAAGLAYLAYTTASHTLATPRWRVLLPLGEAAPPGDRARMVSRANGALGGVLSAESWAISTGFYYGNIAGRLDVEIILCDGEETIDDAQELDATALSFRAPTKAGGQGGKLDLDQFDEHELLELIQTGQVYYGAAKRLLELWAGQKVPEDDAQQNLESAFDAVPVADRDTKWTKRRGNIPRWVKQGYARFAKRHGKFFQALVDHLENAPLWKGAVRFNRFAGNVEVCEPFPPQPGQTIGVYRALSDPADTLETMIVVQGDGFPTASKTTVFDALFLAATRHSCHPLRDWLDSLEWDGAERLNRLFIDYIPGTMPDRHKDSDRRDRVVAYLEDVGSCFLIGAVARIFQPGCKLDTLPLLVSPQNYNKSKALAAFVPEPAWFTDDVPVNVADKDAKQALDGKWIIELAEFPQLRRDVDHVKAFLSRPTDRYRPPYARTVGDWPRQCVFIASVNELELPDVTGNRRFWPVLLAAPVKDQEIAQDREQLWAEVVHWYRAGSKWWLTPQIEAIAAEVQDDFVEPDVRDESIAAWIDLQFPTTDVLGQPIPEAQREKPRFTVRQILERALGFAVDAKDELRSVVATAADEKRVIRRLRRLGYRPDPHRSRADGQQRYWVPVGS